MRFSSGLLAVLLSMLPIGSNALAQLGPVIVLDPDSPLEIAPSEQEPLAPPGNFRILQGEREAETSVRLRFFVPEEADGFRVYRRWQQLASPEGTLAAPPPPDEGVSPFAWKEIVPPEGKLLYGGPGTTTVYLDMSIPSPDPDLPKEAQLHIGPYCYAVEAYNDEGSAWTGEDCTRIRGVDMPSDVKVIGVTSNSATLTWQDNSDIEWGYEAIHGPAEDWGSQKSSWVPGENQQRLVITNLLPDTEYCFAVRAVSFYARSRYELLANEDGQCRVRTLPEPEADPELVTKTIFLERQIVHEGPIPYLATYPPLGGKLGTLVAIRNPDISRPLYFLKPYRSSAECYDPEAVVVAAPQQTLDMDDLEVIYGTDKIELPTYFLACIGGPNAYDNIPIAITYQKAE